MRLSDIVGHVFVICEQCNKTLSKDVIQVVTDEGNIFYCLECFKDSMWYENGLL